MYVAVSARDQSLIVDPGAHHRRPRAAPWHHRILGILLSGAYRSSAMGDSDSNLDLGSDGDGTLPSPSTLVCVGTREVTLQTSERGKSWPSILACFKSKEDPASFGRGGDDAKESPSALTLMFTDGSRTYFGRIKKEDLKSTSENTESLPLLLLDENNSSITISFGLIDIGDAAKPPKIKMTVRERLDSGIVKVVWSDFLESGSAAGNNGNNAYLFASFLSTSLRDANKDIAELRADLSKAKADMTGWKDTASKLDNKWQKEKDGLTERFLVLYNRVKSDLRDAKKELSDEKKKKTVRVEPLVQNALAPEEPSAAKKHNDQEELMWDADMVEMMAAGPAKKPSAAAKSNGASRKVASTTNTATKPSAKRTRHDEATKAKKAARHNGDDTPSKKLSSRAVQDSSDDDEDDLGASQSQARANPVTGSTEMWGPGGIFAETQGGIDDFETYRKKRDAMKKTKAKSSSTAASTDEKALGKQTIYLAGDDSDDSF